MINEHLRGFTDTIGDANARADGKWINISQINLCFDESDLHYIHDWCNKMHSEGATKIRRDFNHTQGNYYLMAYKFKSRDEMREDQIKSLEEVLEKLKSEQRDEI